MNVVFLTVGVISGIMMGSVGAGAGVLLIPLLLWCGMTMKEAVAVSLVLQMVPLSAFGLWTYYKSGHVRIKDSVMVTLGCTVGVFIGSLIANAHYVSERLMKLVLACMMIVSGLWMFLKSF